MNKQVTSTHNPLIRRLIRLQEKPAERKTVGLTVVEGLREISLALSAGFRFTDLVICPEILYGPAYQERLPELFSGVPLVEVTLNVYNHLAYRKDSQGIIGIAEVRQQMIEQLDNHKNPLFLVLETIEKPGNLGAILRTADAAGLNGVIICDSQTDLYNPNVIRSSLGCIFTVPVVSTSSRDAIEWFKNRHIRIYGTAIHADVSYHTISYQQPSAIVMGSEARGLTKIWMDHCDRLIRIPMHGKVDSMNVSVAAAVVVFEALRQRADGS